MSESDIIEYNEPRECPTCGKELSEELHPRDGFRVRLVCVKDRSHYQGQWHE